MGSKTTERAVGPIGRVLLPPCFDLFSWVVKRGKPAKVQELISEFPLEAFDETILRRLAGIDMDNVNLMFFCPCEESLSGTFRPIVDDKALWFPPRLDEPVENFRGCLCRN